MDSNPLADNPPARHAVESDDEDELDTSISHFPSQEEKEGFEIQIRWNPITTTPVEERRGKPLLIACRDAGRVWARGAGFHQTSSQLEGVVLVNNSPFGWIYTPSWAACSCTVLLSEPFPQGSPWGNSAPREKNEGDWIGARTLPLAAMHPYAEGILKVLMPSRIVLLDTYALPTYIGSPKTFYDDTTDHPVRHLSIGSWPFPDKDKDLPLLHFDTPNLLHSTSASFMSVVSFEAAASSEESEAGDVWSAAAGKSSGVRESDAKPKTRSPTPTFLLLLPSPHIPPQPNSRPRQVGVGKPPSPNVGNDGTFHHPYPYIDASSDPSAEWWTPKTMCSVEDLMFRALGGEELDLDRRRGLRWGEELSSGRGKKAAGRQVKPGGNVAVGEGGMYI